MDSNKTNRLRQFYYSLIAQKQILDNIASKFKDKPVVLKSKNLQPIETTLYQLNEEFPEIIPTFNRYDYFSHYVVEGSSHITTYHLTGVQLFLADAISRIQVIIDQPKESITFKECQFKFIHDQALRKIIERDYIEIQKSNISNCWKSVIILCGGTIEAILTDLLLENEAKAKAAKSSPNKSDITRWDLSDLINISVEIDLVSSGVARLSHPIREYRNLVHPGNEIRNKLQFGAEEARIAIEVLNIVHRDLSK